MVNLYDNGGISLQISVIDSSIIPYSLMQCLKEKSDARRNNALVNDVIVIALDHRNQLMEEESVLEKLSHTTN